MGTLVWDFDGTLGHRIGGWAGACIDVLEDADPGCDVAIEDVRPHLQTGYPWHTPEQAHTHVSTADEWWRRIYPLFLAAFEANGVSPDRARALASDVRRTYVERGWRRYEDAIPALSRLADAGWRHVVLSNHVPELPSILESLELTPYLEEIYVSAEIGYEKPHPEAFRPVLADIGFDTTDWDEPDRSAADGDESNRSIADGDESDRSAADGDESDRSAADGDESDRSAVDGDESNRSIVDGDGMNRSTADDDESDPVVWMIGDSYRADVAGARAVGVPGILVRDSHPEAAYACADLYSIDEILDGVHPSS